MLKTMLWDGEPIKKAGCYASIPLDDYHGQDICTGPSVSSSNLRRALECNGGSPAHFYSEWSGNPNPVEPELKDHHILGRAVHHLMLGEPDFAAHFAVRPPEYDSYRTDKAKDWKRDVIAAGLLPLLPSDLDLIRGMSRALGDAVMIEQETGEITRVPELLTGHIERSLIWQDKLTGLWCKARPDCIPTASGDFVDLKTTRSVQYLDLMRTMTEWAYHQQAAMVAEGARQCLGIEMQTYTLIFIEKRYPFCVRPVIVKDEDIALGAKQNRIALSVIAECINQGRFPGPGRERAFEHIDLMSYYRDNAEFELDATKEAFDRARRAG